MGLEAWANTNWDAGIPVLPTLSDEAKQKWSALPIHAKISQILSQVKDDQSATKEIVLKKCWQKSKECASGKDMLEVRERCLQLSPKLKEQKQSITIMCEGEKLEIPHVYKRALAKDSHLFKSIFYGKFKEGTEKQYAINLPKEEVDRVIQIWSGQSLNDAEEAYSLLEASHALDLGLPPIKNTILAGIKTWSPDDAEDVQTASSLAIQLLRYSELGDIQEELVQFLVKAFLHGEHSKNPELANTALNALQELKPYILSLDLRKSDISDSELEKIIANCSNLHSLNLKGQGITNRSIAHIAQLSNLRNLNVTYCQRFTKAGIKELAKLPNLEILDLTMAVNEGLSDEAFKELATKLTNLKHLNLGAQSNLTGEAFNGSPLLPNLLLLDLTGCYPLHTADSLKKLDALPKLESLILTNSPELKDEDVSELAKLTQLKHLDLSHCPQITNVTLGILAQMANLQTVNLSKCKKLNEDIATLTLATVRPDLKILR